MIFGNLFFKTMGLNFHEKLPKMIFHHYDIYIFVVDSLPWEDHWPLNDGAVGMPDLERDGHRWSLNIINKLSVTDRFWHVICIIVHILLTGRRQCPSHSYPYWPKLCWDSSEQNCPFVGLSSWLTIARNRLHLYNWNWEMREKKMWGCSQFEMFPVCQPQETQNAM